MDEREVEPTVKATTTELSTVAWRYSGHVAKSNAVNILFKVCSTGVTQRNKKQNPTKTSAANDSKQQQCATLDSNHT